MKKDNIRYIIFHYNLIPLAIFGGILYLTKLFVFYEICTSQRIFSADPRYQKIYLVLSLICFFTWIYICFTTIRSQHYKSLTGRNYNKDHHEFNKPYSALVRFFTTNDPYKMDISKLEKTDWHDADGVILCKAKDDKNNYHLVKRDSDAPGNLVAFGLPGSGKTTTTAVASALRFNANRKDGGCGVFAISIKGDLLNFVGGKRTNNKVFTPDKAEGSCHYDPLAGIQEMSPQDQRVFAENLAMIICPDEAGENAAFFVQGARAYLAGIVLYLLYLHDEGMRLGKLKFSDITDMILHNDVISITEEIAGSPCKVANEYTKGFMNSNEKNVAGIWSHLSQQIRPFNNGALRILFDGEGDCITPEFLNEGDIYIDVPQDKYDVYAPAMALIVSNFLQAFMQRPDVSSGNDISPILFLLDEAVQLNLNFGLLSKAMSTLRSKKVSLYLLMQSVAQLEGRYGESHAREIMDLCAYVSVFNAQDPKSREYFQKLVGRRKMLKRSTSLSSSGGNKNNTSGVSISEVDEFIFEAADFGDLNTIDPKTKSTIHRVLVYANGKYVLGETTPCYE